MLPCLLVICVPHDSFASEFPLFRSTVPASHFFPPAAGAPTDRADGLRHLFPAAFSREETFDPAALRDLSAELAAAEAPATAPRLFTRGTTLVTTGVLVAITAWAALGVQKDDYTPFKFTREKFFGKDTYSGGADKCSHFILSAFLTRELAWVYQEQGHSREQSLGLSLGVTVLSGVIQEIGDGFTPYGYAWEDIAADTMGSVTGAALSYYDLNDLVGLRFGFVSDGVAPDPCCQDSLGENYSQEIYSGDLKLAGLAKRMRFNPGPARFLLVSATYSTRAYGTEPKRPDRQRNVGIDVGLNMPEILSAVGVPETTWWGSILYKALNLFRIPFTSFGIRYDINHKKWHGPDTGNVFQ
ncbi:MAG: DUF2279 domain-containing protein [Acidobacteriota bacterium]